MTSPTYCAPCIADLALVREAATTVAGTASCMAHAVLLRHSADDPGRRRQRLDALKDLATGKAETAEPAEQVKLELLVQEYGLAGAMDMGRPERRGPQQQQPARQGAPSAPGEGRKSRRGRVRGDRPDGQGGPGQGGPGPGGQSGRAHVAAPSGETAPAMTPAPGAAGDSPAETGRSTTDGSTTATSAPEAPTPSAPDAPAAPSAPDAPAAPSSPEQSSPAAPQSTPAAPQATPAAPQPIPAAPEPTAPSAAPAAPEQPSPAAPQPAAPETPSAPSSSAPDA